MNQPYPGPQQPPYQPPHPGYPGPYGPPPPKKGLSGGAIAAIIIGSLFALLILLIIGIGALASTPDSGDKSSAPTRPTAEASTEQQAPAPPKTREPAKKAPVVVTAKKATFAPGVLHNGGPYTSVSVTVTNNSGESIDINPLYFTITDTDGSKHTAELGMDESQMNTVDLAPGENITGTITGKGDFSPKYVTYTNGLFGEGVRGNVS